MVSNMENIPDVPGWLTRLAVVTMHEYVEICTNKLNVDLYLAISLVLSMLTFFGHQVVEAFVSGCTVGH